MGAFELRQNEVRRAENEHSVEVEEKTGHCLSKNYEDCIITLKVYDQCRSQDCLTGRELGPARAAESKTIAEKHICEGDIIDPLNDMLRISGIVN